MMGNVGVKATVAVAMLLVVWSNNAWAQAVPRKMTVADDAGRDPALKSVRDKLLAAAKAHELAVVLTMVSSDISVSYRNDKHGIQALRDEWGIARSPDRFLRELTTILSLGGRFDESEPGTFVAPSLFLDYPDVTSMGSHEVVIHAASPVYERPDEGAVVIAGSLSMCFQ